MSELHAREARAAFLHCISQGEGAMDLAEAALQVASEDDALGEEKTPRALAGPCLQAISSFALRPRTPDQAHARIVRATSENHA